MLSSSQWGSLDLDNLMDHDLTDGRTFGRFWQHVWRHGRTCGCAESEVLGEGLRIYDWFRDDASMGDLWDSARRNWDLSRSHAVRYLGAWEARGNYLIVARYRAVLAGGSPPAPRITWKEFRRAVGGAA